MKNYSPVLIAIAFLVGTWAIYYANFGGSFSSDQGDWGVFGDYTGGILNPLLNFITIYLLIQSLVVQKNQMDQTKDDLDNARKNDNIRAFESSLFTFSRIALDEYNNFKPTINDIKHDVSGSAISTIEGIMLSSSKTKQELDKQFNELDDETHAAIYSLTRSFCALFKITTEICPTEEQSRYLDMISLIIPTKAQYLLIMAECFTGWGMLDHPRALGFFNRAAVKEIIDVFNSIIDTESPDTDDATDSSEQ